MVTPHLRQLQGQGHLKWHLPVGFFVNEFVLEVVKRKMKLRNHTERLSVNKKSE